ncbi:EamA family transporter RarD [Aestuariimicrobium ganziense]|uniref:EamA family transporter RarD n=1 Tax=Aestuariimicrobium ganziense TaxID=2773677 RepID=UPI001942156D|nr:EamA family transporter RarD [Aestuariimicrobium ganziense]
MTTPPADSALPRDALLSGVAAYAMWGLFPLFWVLLADAGAVETLAHRIVWSLVAVAVALAVGRGSFAWVRPTLAAHGLQMMAAAALIAVNWGMFIYAVTSNHTVESSLGYFINPLVNLVLGWLVFGERLDRFGRIGALLAFVGVVVISAQSWRTVWISLVLAGSFGLYGMVKKKTSVPALQTLFLESLLLLVPSLAWLGWLAARGEGRFGTDWGLTGLFLVSGALTALPLFFFALAAKGLPLGTLGVLQYIGPTGQFLIGWLLFDQGVSLVWWIGMVVVWSGCVVYLVGMVRRQRRVPR